MEYDLLYDYEYLEIATCRILIGGGAQRIPDIPFTVPCLDWFLSSRLYYQCDKGCKHKVHTYKEYHSVCPLVGIGILPRASLSIPPESRGGSTLASVWWGGGVPNPTTWKKA